MNVDGKTLRAYVERWQSLEDNKVEAAEDQKALLDDMEKNDNIERKPFKTLIRYLKDEEASRVQLAKFEALLATYLNFENTPLGRHLAKNADAALHAEGAKLGDEMAAKRDGDDTVTLRRGDAEFTSTVAEFVDAAERVRRKITP